MNDHPNLATVASPFSETSAVWDWWNTVAQNAELGMTHWADEFVLYAPTHLSMGAINAQLAHHGQQLSFHLPTHWTLAQAFAYNIPSLTNGWQMDLRQSTLGLHWMDAQGIILGTGGRVLKNVTGYDIHRMQLGAHGILGLPIGVSLRTTPIPSHRYTRYYADISDEARVETLFKELKKAPPQGLQHLDLMQVWDQENTSYTLVLDIGWQGDTSLFNALFKEFAPVLIQNVANRNPVDEPMDAALHPLVSMANDYPILMHAHVPAPTFSMAFMDQIQAVLKPKSLRYSSGSHDLWMAWEAQQGHTLMRLIGQLNAMLTIDQLRNLSVWKAPTGLDAFSQSAWAAQLDDTLWQQYASLRVEWGIAADQFHSPFVNANMYTVGT